MKLFARALAAMALALLLVAPALAHRSPQAGPKTGLSLPSVTHGQMVVLAAHLAAIRAIADEQYPTDPTMRRLQAYINLQHFYCAWGLVPGNLVDEGSPFNECTHAYLAGVRALMLHLQDMPGDHEGKLALARTATSKCSNTTPRWCCAASATSRSTPPTSSSRASARCSAIRLALPCCC